VDQLDEEQSAASAVIRTLLLALPLAVLIVGCEETTTSSEGPNTGGATGPGTDQKAGGTASDFTTRDIDGRTFRLSDHIGKEVILIDFWATWCQPCLAEWPHLQKMYEEQKAKGFVVVAVSMDGADSIADVPSFARRNQVTFPVVYDEDSHIASIYNPRKSAPLNAIIDRSGRVVSIREGYNAGDEVSLYADVKKFVDAAKAAPAPAPTAKQ
jgi:peroxiredoxin